MRQRLFSTACLNDGFSRRVSERAVIIRWPMPPISSAWLHCGHQYGQSPALFAMGQCCSNVVARLEGKILVQIPHGFDVAV
jgi:hypothetical protein